MISEWNFSMVKYWANAGETRKIRLRLKMRKITNLRYFIWLFIFASRLFQSAIYNLKSEIF